MSTIRYLGFCPESKAGPRVVCIWGVNHEPSPLPPRHDLCNHSPDGFSWGYGGSGPAQLALAILADALGDDNRALDLHQSFKWGVIARLPDEAWTISLDEIRLWAADPTHEVDVVSGKVMTPRSIDELVGIASKRMMRMAREAGMPYLVSAGDKHTTPVTRRLPPNYRCPGCQATLGACTGDGIPCDGDVTVCCECGAVLQFDPAGGLVAAPAGALGDAGPAFCRTFERYWGKPVHIIGS